MAHVERLTVYPVKALDGQDREAVRITEAGGLAGDREYALFGPDGDPVNGKRTDRVHDLSTAFDPDARELTVDPDDGRRRRFHLDEDREAAETWFGEFFDLPVSTERDATTGFPDRPDAGPSVISTATLETVVDWFDEVTVDGLRRRLRANVEVEGVPAFWEDRFANEDAPAFEVGGVRFEGVERCGRCVVPQRDPDTGERTPAFRERFVRRRRETYPEWVDPDAVGNDYTLMLIAAAPREDRGGTIGVGDEVRVLESDRD
ncbi:molybdenum cofactor biosysynthesis protein [Halobacteriales archaeon QS_1_68_20]|nr:MAG: molybdenum cofactor biosysynthesis protein [Halobacteriales archaeon QS_1_68_20]